MVTNAEFVASVIGGLKLLNKDEHISRRWVLARGRTKATTYNSQKLLDRTLYRESQLFVSVDCFQLKPDDIVKCDIVSFRKCTSLMKSVKPIPTPIFSKYGPSILRVVSLDDGVEFDYSASFSLVSDSKRQFADKVYKYYLDSNNYIYIPNSSVESVSMEILTLDVKEATELSSCSDVDICKSIWEYPFVCPDKLLAPIIEEVILEVRNNFKIITEDENPNLDSNQKGQTIV